jgi:hypothetical protein
MSGRTDSMKALSLGLAVGLLVLTAGCSSDDDKPVCEVTCADGFKTEQEGGCPLLAAFSYALAHNTSCTQEEHWR